MGPAGFLKTRFYYDQYYSDLRSYDSSDYSFQTKRSSFTSIYFDDSFGGSAECHMDITGKHNVKAAVHYKYDHHREHNTWPVVEAVRHMIDQFISAGVEENWSPLQNLLIIGGISYNFRDNIRADNFDSANRDAALNAQLGAEYHFAKNQDVRISLARKTRFATMKDRYSYRLGRSLPNPELKSESAFHVDLNYSASAGNFLKSEVSLFCSMLDNTIQPVYGIDPDNSFFYQMQNTGKAVFYGLETDLRFMPFNSLLLGLQYTFLERKNLSHPDIMFVNVPQHRVFGYLKYSKSGFYIVFDSGFNSERPSTSDGLYIAEGFFISNIKASINILKVFAIEAGIGNLFDADYCYYEGYPEEGRNYNISLRYFFKKN
jgi:iron complex outermembrane receptor protein